MASRLLLGARGRKLWVMVMASFAAVAVFALGPVAGAQAQTTSTTTGGLDCNGNSPIQQAVHVTAACTDVRGAANVSNANTDEGRFYDNGTYIGHDEPDMAFFSNRHGSGNEVTWAETLGQDPAAAPTVNTPGSDVAHWFELSIAPWFSMNLCDPKSYPQNACAPQSDANAPQPCTISANPCTGGYTGGGSAFMELQFYPPGFSPFADAVSCDNAHWCAAMNIDSLACNYNFATCNPKCTEPLNFAYVQRDGVPTGPPSPQEANLATATPNSKTLLMNPADKVTVHMFNAPVPGQRGARAFTVVIYDQTTHQVGFMQASAANGFQNTSMADCSGAPFDFQPEYNTSNTQNISPWAALRVNVSTQFEIGHFTPCTSVTDSSSLLFAPGISDTVWKTCHGPYENAAPGGDAGASSPEVSDAPCYPVGDTHGALNTPPDTVTGCINTTDQNGDLDFDGSPYWPEWPTSSDPTARFPGSFVQSLPTTEGAQYPLYQVQTDLALSESTCSATTGAGCSVPPTNAPGNFYPYWSRVSKGNTCVIEFGNVSSGHGVDNLGGDAQYGTDQSATLGYPEFLGPVQSNSCAHGHHPD
ncbi:MAG: hypothetical protein M3065_17155 [Actinomycetota bacterium]|nr:hypothetical protein [Actinomycetota bacterium]